MTATPFNEAKSRLVWAEAMCQAKDMLQSWLSYNANGLRCTADDTRTLALHVLAYAGFQKSYPFRSITRNSVVDQPSTYRDSLAIILKNIFMVMIFLAKAFQMPFLPTKWKQIGWAVTQFREYMLTQLAEEKNLIAQERPGSGMLISNLVRASTEASQGMDEPINQRTTSARRVDELKPLSVDEILGNIFVFNFAGHDITAISLAYIILLLTAHPEIQDWIAEELNFYLRSSDSSDWKYEDIFPKLKRCLAVLLETLRLYIPLLGVPKYTGSPAAMLQIDANKTPITIPANTIVMPNLMALHTHPRYWGADSLTWRPSRWIQHQPPSPPPSSNNPSSPHPSSAANNDLGARLSAENLLVPSRGTFIAWSEGARNCPGKRFAQVEFVATMAALFRAHRVEPVRRRGRGSGRGSAEIDGQDDEETLEQARKRVLGVVQDSKVELLLQMRDPDSVAVRWMKR